MEYNVFDEKNVTVIKCNFIVPVERPHTIVSYNMQYNMVFSTEKEMYKYVEANKLNILNHYELYYYDLKGMGVDTGNMSFQGLNMRAASIIAYRKNQGIVDVNMLKVGNRYVLKDGIEIIYLGYIDNRYHYLTFKDYLERMNAGKQEYEMDNPKRLKKRLTISYQKMPTIIGDLGPYWNEKCFKIIDRKVYGVEE